MSCRFTEARIQWTTNNIKYENVDVQKAANTACTGRLVGCAKEANPGEKFFPFRWLVLASRQ